MVIVTCIYYFILSGLNRTTRCLADRATQRLKGAFAESTKSSYNHKFRYFLAFCILNSIQLQDVNVYIVLAFLEFLVFNKFSHGVVKNYVSALKSYFVCYGLPTSVFSDRRITYFIKALQKAGPHTAVLRPIIDKQLLLEIADTCDTMADGYIFKAVYLTAFFSFLRISNLVSHSINKFSPFKQLTRGDVIFCEPGAVLIVKWSKTLQTNNAIRLLKIPFLHGSNVCPVTALKILLHMTPCSKNHPLFQIRLHGNWVPLTDTRVRKHLKLILNRLDLCNTKLTFHSFRRSGATLAFNTNASLQSIQAQGTWTSDCVWRYITQDENTSDEVALSFQNLFSTH